MSETFIKTKIKPALKRSATGGTRASNSKRPASKLIVQKSTQMNPIKDPDSPKAHVDNDNDKYKVWYEEHQAKMKVVDTLVNEEDNLFAALDILHPHLHDLLQSKTRKLQRKIDTQELK